MVTDWKAFDDCVSAMANGPRCVLKIVVFDDDDYAYARLAAKRYPLVPVYLQVGNPVSTMAPEGPAGIMADVDDLMRRFRWLVGKVTADRWFTATVLPQLHVLAWGNRRGV
jgi:7-carboxy-7-deazaguanine synthase